MFNKIKSIIIRQYALIKIGSTIDHINEIAKSNIINKDITLEVIEDYMKKNQNKAIINIELELYKIVDSIKKIVNELNKE